MTDEKIPGWPFGLGFDVVYGVAVGIEIIAVNGNQPTIGHPDQFGFIGAAIGTQLNGVTKTQPGPPGHPGRANGSY